MFSAHVGVLRAQEYDHNVLLYTYHSGYDWTSSLEFEERSATTVAPTPRALEAMYCILFFPLFSSITDSSSNTAEQFSKARSWRLRRWWTILGVSYGWIPYALLVNIYILVRLTPLYRLLSTNAYAF